MSDTPDFDALVTSILEGKAPPRVRTAAARGALPLPRVTLTRLFIHLRGDEADEIRQAAEDSLASLDTDAVRALLSDESCTPDVLEHYAADAARDESLAEKLAFHPAVPPAALDILASSGNASVIELVLTNQESLIARPQLLDLLIANPAVRPDQRGRLLDVLERVNREIASRPVEEPAIEELDDEEIARLLDVDVGELLSRSDIMGSEDFETAEEPEVRTAFQRIVTLSVGQKAVLALKGGREERQILIRDTNKIVSLGVLKNPRINDGEVGSIAQMRNVSDEILRQISNRRAWVKIYSIVYSLVLNPKTPPAVSTNFISRLTTKDLKAVRASKEVPELIRRMAKRSLDRRSQRTDLRKAR